MNTPRRPCPVPYYKILELVFLFFRDPVGVEDMKRSPLLSGLTFSVDG